MLFARSVRRTGSEAGPVLGGNRRVPAFDHAGQPADHRTCVVERRDARGDVIERWLTLVALPLAIHLGRVLVALALDLDNWGAANWSRWPSRRTFSVWSTRSRRTIACCRHERASAGPPSGWRLAWLQSAGSSNPLGRGWAIEVRPSDRSGRDGPRQVRATVGAVEDRWTERHGAARIGALRPALAALVEPRDFGLAPIRIGLAAPPDCWRAAEPAARVLPHAPMVLHRGGFPDGA